MPPPDFIIALRQAAEAAEKIQEIVILSEAKNLSFFDSTRS